MDNKVYVVKCPDYTQAEEKLGELLSLAGGIGRYVSAGEELLLKVNLLAPAAPEKAISTHPAVVAAAARAVAAAGGKAIIADCPGAYQHSAGVLKKTYEICGMTDAAADSGAELSYDVGVQEVSYPEGKLMRHFEVMAPVLNTAGNLNLCKLKTHMFMSMTGAVKNSFGVIPGLAKKGYHAKLQDKEQFAGMLLDLSHFVAPRLSIMDAVVGMEGEGPGASGTPRPVGLLLCAENPLALDVVAAEIIGLEKKYNPLLLAAEKQGLTPTDMSGVELVGAELDDIKIHDFQFPKDLKKSMVVVSKVPGPVSALVKSLFTQTPRVAVDRCIGCGLCRDSCPVKAIVLTDKKKAKIDASKCIRCYCCHELCPHKAIALKRGILG